MDINNPLVYVVVNYIGTIIVLLLSLFVFVFAILRDAGIRFLVGKCFVVKLNLFAFMLLYEPRYEKTGFLHMRKQRRRSASR